MTVNWQYRASHWSAGNPPSGTKGLNIEALINQKTGGKRVSDEQSLLVMSGSEGRISAGRSIAYAEWFYWYSRDHVYLV